MRFPATGRLLVLIAVACAPLAFSLGDELMDQDPAQYADVASRMLRSGDWLHLRDMNGPFVNKPPLMMWAQAASMAVLGVSDLAARVPALLFGLLALLGTFLIGRELRDARLGAIATVLLAGSVAWHHMIADPKTDMALTAMTTLSIACALIGLRRPALRWVAWALAGLAVLAKGPIGLVIVVFALGPELWRTKQVRALAPLRGLLVAAAVAAPFYAALASDQGGAAAWYVLVTQGVGRVLGTGDFRDSTTPLYFLHTGLWALLPMAPLVAVSLARRLKGAPSLARVPAWWFVLVFAVISISRFKLPQYVYWLAPPAALLAAEEFVERPSRAWRTAFLVIGVGAVTLGVIVLVVVFPVSPPVLTGFAAMGLAFVAAQLALRDDVERTVASALAATLGILVLYHAWIHPRLLEYQPGAEIGAIARRAGAERLQVIDAPRSFSMAFGAQREVAGVGVEDALPGMAVVDVGTIDRLRARFHVSELGRWPSYAVSVPRRVFLEESTRAAAVRDVALVKLEPL